MARARLHLICGNCGCNDAWEWEHVSDAIDHGDGTFSPDVHLVCRNCSTLHGLSDNAEHKQKRVNREHAQSRLMTGDKPALPIYLATRYQAPIVLFHDSDSQQLLASGAWLPHQRVMDPFGIRHQMGVLAALSSEKAAENIDIIVLSAEQFLAQAGTLSDDEMKAVEADFLPVVQFLELDLSFLFAEAASQFSLR